MSDFIDNIDELLSADENAEEFPRNEKKIWKFWFTLGFLMIGLLAVVIRLFNIQILDNEKYKEIAKKQNETQILIPSARGIIYDRNHNPLATNIITVSIAADPKIIKNPIEISKLIEKNFNLPYSSILKKLSNKKKRFIWLVRGVDPNLTNELKALKEKGLIFFEEPKRFYPYGEYASQIVGYTNIDNVGISGIEFSKNENLSGEDGFFLMKKDALQNLYYDSDLLKVDAKNGKDIVLSIDINFQRIMQYELKLGVKESEADGGIAIAIEPNTGEILAMANYPDFNPNIRSTIKPEYTKIRAISEEYAPGSTFKLITVASALEEGVANESDTVYGNNGSLTFKWGTIRDVHGFGKSTFRKAVWESSNIVMANTAQKLSDKKFYSYIRNFGFGNKLDLDFPGEITGKLKKPNEFYVSSKRYMGHGYDLTCTPLQIVNAYAAIANDGIMMQAYLIKSISGEDDEVKKTANMKVRRVVSEKTALRVRDLLIGVVDSGSGKRSHIEDIRIAGKTGTSQKLVDGRYSKSEYYASFAGFFPALDPKVALLVIIDRPRKSIYGGVNAAPIFKRIAQGWMGINYGKTVPDLLSDTILAPDLMGLNYSEAEIITNNLNLVLKSNYEEGICFFQNPQPGGKIKRGEEIKITVLKKNENSNSIMKYNLEGLPLKNALNLLHTYKIKTYVTGSGKVKTQTWEKVKDKYICRLVCS